MARILIVEDEVSLAECIKKGLEDEHHLVNIESNGNDGFQKAKNEKYDAIILDLMLPKMSGLELCQKLREQNCDTPIIMLTAKTTKDDIILGLQVGANDYLTKPFCFDELLARVERLLRDHASQRLSIDEIGSHVVDPITRKLRDPRETGLGGKKTQGVLLFLDIRGYTAMAQHRDPEETMNILNSFFNDAVPVIERNGGVIDKFVGDGMMALFGVPHSGGNDALHAINASIELQALVRKVNRNHYYGHDVHLQVGIGCAQGEIIAGYIGSQHRYSFTAIGPAVNLAARLCTYARGAEILCCNTCYSAVRKHVEVEYLEPICLKGIDTPVKAHCIRGWSSLKKPSQRYFQMRKQKRLSENLQELPATRHIKKTQYAAS